MVSMRINSGFDGESMVLTKDKGYIPLKQVCVGELVYANGKFTAVNKIDKVDYSGDSVWCIHPSNSIKIKCLEDTQIEYLGTYRHYKDGKSKRKFDKEVTVGKVCDMNKSNTDYLCIALPDEIEMPNWGGVINERYGTTMNAIDGVLWSEPFWWTIGRYIADGHIRYSGGIAMTIGNDKMEESKKNICPEFHFCTEAMPACNVTRLHFASKELEAFCRQFGCTATEKCVPPEYMMMSIRLTRALMEGYFSGDGHKSGKYMDCRTVSKKLALALGIMIPTAYGVPAYLGFSEMPKKKMIKGKIYNQNDIYRVYYSNRKDKNRLSFISGGKSWAYNRRNPVRDEKFNGEMYGIITESGEIAINNISFKDNSE